MENILLSSIHHKELVSNIAKEVLVGLKEMLDNQIDHKSKEEQYLTRKETAKLLKVSLVTLSNWTKSSRLKSYKIGNRVLYKRSEVIESLREIEQVDNY